MNSLRRRDRSTAIHDQEARDDETDGRQLQCLDCYTIFESDDPARRAECDSCGSPRTEPW